MAAKADVLAMLDELVALTTLEEESPQSFKVRAYEKAKLGIQSYQADDFMELSASQLTKLDGVGKSTAQKVRQFIETGTVDKLETLRETYPPAFVELSRIPGLGPKTVKLVRSKLGVENVEDLKAAIAAKKLRTLPRMGEASEAKIAKAVDRLGLAGKDRRTPIKDALPLAQRLEADLRTVESVVDVAYCGSLRRMSETIGDIDITVAATDAPLVMDHVRNHHEVSEIVVSGETKTSFLTSGGLQIDVRVVEPQQFGAATLYFTGSKAHNIALRQRAIDRDLLLNEYGLFPSDDNRTPIASATEQDIYQSLDLAYIPPPLREGTGEIDAAAEGKLDLVQLEDIRGDLHYHTDRSGDGRSTLEEMVEAAANRGYEYLAITDHGEDLSINGVNEEQMLEHRENIENLQSHYPDMVLLFGCELNIDGDGNLDYSPEFRQLFDYTVASVHSHFDQPTKNQTTRLVKAIAEPSVNSIGHLTGRYIGRRPGIELDIDIVLEAMVAFDVALEVNGALKRLDAAADVVRRAVDRGVKLAINTDSHHKSEVERMTYGVQAAQRGWAPKDLVVNTWDRDRFIEWVSKEKPATL